MTVGNLYLLGKMFKNVSPVRQDLSGKFGCPVLSGKVSHMPSPVEPCLEVPHLKCIRTIQIQIEKKNDWNLEIGRKS